MFCKNCGREIDDKAIVCPHCGVAVSREAMTLSSPKTNTLAIVGFVLSFFVAIAGLVCSIIARKQCKERGEGGAGLALAGIIISAVSMAIAFIYLIVVVIIAAGAISAL